MELAIAADGAILPIRDQHNLLKHGSLVSLISIHPSSNPPSHSPPVFYMNIPTKHNHIDEPAPTSTRSKKQARRTPRSKESCMPSPRTRPRIRRLLASRLVHLPRFSRRSWLPERLPTLPPMRTRSRAPVHILG